MPSIKEFLKSTSIIHWDQIELLPLQKWKEQKEKSQGFQKYNDNKEINNHKRPKCNEYSQWAHSYFPFWLKPTKEAPSILSPKCYHARIPTHDSLPNFFGSKNTTIDIRVDI